MIKADEMGDYDDEKIPEGLVAPFSIDIPNEAIVGDDNAIIARYAGGTIETSILVLERRKAEFLTRMANGEIQVRKDKDGNFHVFKKLNQSMRSGRLVIEYEEVKESVES